MPRYNGGFIGHDGLDAPDAPTIGTPSAGSAQADIAFTAGTAGTTATTEFVATTNDGIGATGTSSPITITGLTNGTSYTARVYAKNSHGTSAASEASASFTPLAEVINSLFSTYLYTGSSGSKTITNNINFSNKGGLLWIKNREASQSHYLFDTERGAGKGLRSNGTFAEYDYGSSSGFNHQFTSTGFSFNTSDGAVNNGDDFVSWSFRKQPKFFDIVTYTGDGNDGRTISHSLGSTPGMIIVARRDNTNYWRTWHRSQTGKYANLYDTGAFADDSSSSGVFNDYSGNSSTFTAGININANGATYVAYIFAHNNSDGGFGPDSEDIIKCGSYTGNNSTTGPVINLGFEPQFVMVKRADSADEWFVYDVMREFDYTTTGRLSWDASSAESDSLSVVPTPTGFQPVIAHGSVNASGGTYIYMAIRRGGMSTPTSASDVFAINTGDGNGSSTVPQFTSGFPVDFAYLRPPGSTANNNFYSRLTGNKYLSANSTASETTDSQDYSFESNTGWYLGSTNWTSWMWKRARGFFDVVTYKGTGSATTINHNLGVAPEMIWLKSRDSAENWQVGADVLTGTWERIVYLNLTSGEGSSNAVWWNNTAPTSSVFSIGTQDMNNKSGDNYIAFLFASVTGISKIGSYTGDGTTDGSKVIDCGFAPKFILIKKIINGSGNWRIYDTERGIPAGGDPALLFNQTDAQSSTADSIDTTSSGFTVIDGNTNANTDGYLFYAIA